jgi:hypothetical protein
VTHDPRPRRPDEPQDSSADGDGLARLIAGARRIPTGLAAPGGLLFLLVLADRVGLSLPGTHYVRRVLDDPLVFLAVRLFVITLIAVGILIAIWIGRSVLAWIREERWVRRIVGLEPQMLHRGAKDVEDGVAELLEVLAETNDRNADLVVALERTSERLRELELQSEDDERDDYQLRLGDGR